MEWLVRPVMGVDTPRYVISFDELPVESDCLKLEEGSNVFREKFTKPGIYAYKCQIHTRMKGKIEVKKRGW